MENILFSRLHDIWLVIKIASAYFLKHYQKIEPFLFSGRKALLYKDLKIKVLTTLSKFKIQLGGT